MNSMELKDRIRNISRERNVDFNTLLRLYMYDRFIERLSVSNYKKNFILKGGFYLSTLLGVEQRSTMDIDIAFQHATFSKDVIIEIINNIIAININDSVTINYIGIDEIRDEDDYGGYRIDLEARLDNVKERFHIDVATGDPITPSEIRYNYKPLLTDKYIDVYAYTIETVIAEKIETILSRVEANSRMRDFYDIYLIYTKEHENIRVDVLKLAIERTFKKRNYDKSVFDTLKVIENSDVLKNRWDSYRNNYNYATNIEYDKVITCIRELLKTLNTSIDINTLEKEIGRRRATRTNTVLDKKINRFIVMCIEQYASYVNKGSSIVYNKLNEMGIINELRDDYEDMHGMSTYSLNEYIDKRLGEIKELLHISKDLKMDHVLSKTILISDTIELIAKKYKLSIEEARNKFYESDVVEMLDDDETGLYGSSALYLVSLYDIYLQKNKK